MDKIDHKSRDILGGNIEKIAELFPGVVTEAQDEATGELKKVVDFDLLRQHLSDTLVEGDRERFRLDWPGKKASILKANTPTTKTLRPVREDSEYFDTTGNVFIEGDNFEVLKVLQESYLGKIKMIYIDPPYNTGKDFIYRDNFAADREDYEEEIGVRDDENGGKLVKNTETNGRYHSDWLSMVQERLIVARDLLTDDGVIFISIDDNEQANLKKLCDDVFDEANFAAQIIWKKKVFDNNEYLPALHDYHLVYSKQKDSLEFNLLPRNEQQLAQYKYDDKDGNGLYKFEKLTAPTSGGRYSQATDFIITDPKDGSEYKSNTGNWRFGKNTIAEMIARNEINFDGSLPRYKLYLKDVKDGVSANTFWDDVDKNLNAAKQILDLFGYKAFETPKPIGLIKKMLYIATNTDSVVLDFFSGSSTTAHAVMQLNAEDGGNRKHIQVQLAEPTDEKSEAYKAGYKTIPEISRERIRRAAKKIREDYAEQIAKRDTPLDTGFRAYNLSSSNFINTAQHPNETTQASLLETANNIKEDRTPEDLLTETILDLGLTLDLPIEVRDVAGHTVYLVGGNSLIACFDDTVSLDIVDGIAAEKPLRVVFKDSSFANDETRINIDIRLRQLVSDIIVQVV